MACWVCTLTVLENTFITTTTGDHRHGPDRNRTQHLGDNPETNPKSVGDLDNLVTKMRLSGYVAMNCYIVDGKGAAASDIFHAWMANNDIKQSIISLFFGDCCIAVSTARKVRASTLREHFSVRNFADRRNNRQLHRIAAGA
jgi:hypothetical protein